MLPPEMLLTLLLLVPLPVEPLLVDLSSNVISDALEEVLIWHSITALVPITAIAYLTVFQKRPQATTRKHPGL